MTTSKKPASLKALRSEAVQKLRIAQKVVHYRRDVLPEKDLIELQASVRDLNEKRGAKHVTAVQLEPALKRLETNLLKCGGKIYPRHGWNDNVEMLLVAAIIVLGIRTFFLQPFIIPTNSMYPTYSGMTFQTYTVEETPPAPPMQVARFLVRGAKHHYHKAPTSGEVLLPVAFGTDGEGRQRSGIAFEAAQGRNFFVLPAQRKAYTFLVDGEPVRILIPAEASIDQVVKETFFPGDSRSLEAILLDRRRTQGLVPGPGGRAYMRTFREVEAGEQLLAFDILLGDALFVDRMSYHFAAPDIGDPFVFRTDSIPSVPEEKYYIKRLVGKGGDTLEIQEPILIRNGEPIQGAGAFQQNQIQNGDYGGYIAAGYLSEGQTVELPEGTYWAMGDNSDESSDSRLWAFDPRQPNSNDADHNGLVPDQAVIGKAILIYYPFTKRWGLAE